MASPLVFLYDDYAIAASGVVINNTVPALAGYPAVNVLHPDRDVVFRSPSNPGGQFDIDIYRAGVGADDLFSGIGIMNVTSADPVDRGPSFDIYGGNTFGGSMALVASLDANGGWYWPTATEWIADFGAYYSWRCIRVTVRAFSYQVTIGKVIIGKHVTLPFAYWPDSGYDNVTPGIELRRRDSTPVGVVTGATRRAYSYRFDEVSEGEKEQIEQLRAQKYPMGHIDAQGNSVHVRQPVPRRTPFRQRSDAVWGTELTLEQLVS